MPFRNVFRVDETSGRRWELALERLRAGDLVVVLDVAISLAEPGIVKAIAASAWSSVARVTAESAVADIRRAEGVLAWACEGSPEFKRELGSRQVEVELVVDYETGTVLVARSRQEGVNWADGRPLLGSG